MTRKPFHPGAPSFAEYEYGQFGYVRELGHLQFVQAVLHLFRWHVEHRYYWGPFTPIIERRKFRRTSDAEQWFREVQPR